MSTAITVRAVSFELPNGRALFQNTSFNLGDGVTALVGPNGVGKSCLARLLAGDLQPSSGQIIAPRSITYLAQREDPPAIPVGTYLQAHPEARSSALLQGISHVRLCSHLSGGQWMRLRLACALSSAFTILDEPTNDLDPEARATVLAFIASRRRGLLLISHDPTCLALCEHVMELSNRGLHMYEGSWDDYVRDRDRERARLFAALDSAKAERDKVKRARQTAHERQEKRAAHGARHAARGDIPRIARGSRRSRAENTAGRVDAACAARANDAVRAAHEAYDALKVDPVMYADLLGKGMPAGKLVAEAEDFNVQFDGAWVYENDLTFAWRGNVRVAVSGPNGCGKTTLLRALAGDVQATRGLLKVGDLPQLYIDQRCAQVDESASVLHNVCQRTGLSEADARNGLAKFLFAGDTVFQPISTLSGGERLRAALASGFLAPIKPQCLVLDEPTNNLDAANVAFLEELVRLFPGAVIVVSHDERFLAACGVADAWALRGA